MINTGSDVTDATLLDAVTELIDRQRITDLMLAFGRSLDLHDWAGYRSTFVPGEFYLDFSDLTGRPPTLTTADDWTAFTSLALGPLVLQHQYSNFQITLKGDRAEAVVYYVARHRRPNRHGADDYTQYGWYDLSVERTEPGWLIDKLRHSFQWCDGNPTLIDLNEPALVAAAHKVFGP